MHEDEGDVLEGEDEEKKKEDEDERVEQNDVGEQRSTLTQRCCGPPHLHASGCPRTRRGSRSLGIGTAKKWGIQRKERRDAKEGEEEGELEE